ncbi:MAG TPA: TRAP transporter substrate-binding protein [Pseudolabrys sp.]|nr:TRAP transporter substrate-binding protein [Pseudolabrys sp.]
MAFSLGLNRRHFVLGSASAALAAPAFRRASAATDLRLAHPADVTHPVHIEAEAMVKRISERTNGALNIKIFANNALGSPVEAAQQTKLGAIDMMLFNPANIESMSKSIGVVNIPYQFDNYEHAHKTLDETGRGFITKTLADAGFTWIANFEWGFRATSNSKRPINVPADVQGLRIRVPPELAIKAAFEALGASTQTVAFQEVYLALANNLVDGQDNPIGTTFAAKFFEVQKHIALTRHIYASIMFCANPRKWSALPEDQRKIIQEEAKIAGAAARKSVRDGEEGQVAKMEKAGLTITRPDPAAFRAKMEPAYAQLRKGLGDEVWNTWAKHVADARG